MCISYMPRRAQTNALLEKQRLNDLFAAASISKESEPTHQRGPHVVHHEYHDHSRDVIRKEEINPPISRGGVRCPFPLKLHEMLDQIEKDGHSDVISWQPHGRCFVVHQPKEFVRYVMPLYFNQSKFSSFQRQLNLYGFNRITQGLDKRGYYHELFLRGKRPLTRKISRTKVKGTFVRGRSSPESEPNFYAMPFIGCDGNIISSPLQTEQSGEANEAVKESSDLPCEIVPSFDESSVTTAIAMDDSATTRDESCTCAVDDCTATTAEETVSSCSSSDDESRTSLCDSHLESFETQPSYITSAGSTNDSQTSPVMCSLDTTLEKLPAAPCNPCADDSDDVLTFEGKTFHYLDTHENNVKVEPLVSNYMEVENMNSNELDHFLDTLRISRSLYDDIVQTMDDDNNFGSLLEKVIE